MVQVDVRQELTRYTALRDQLQEQFYDIDDETLSDTLEGISDFREILTELIRSALDDEAIAAGLCTRLADMKARLQRLGHRAEKKRALVLRAMSEAEIQKLLQPDFTASLRQAGPTLEVQADNKIPPAYWKPQPPKLDRQLLLTDLKRGIDVEGAALAAPALQLTIRTK
jgi:hypothetical protein